MEDAGALELLQRPDEDPLAITVEQLSASVRGLTEAVKELRASQGRSNEILLAIAEMLQVAIVPDLTTEQLPSLRVIPGLNTPTGYRPGMFKPSR